MAGEGKQGKIVTLRKINLKGADKPAINAVVGFTFQSDKGGLYDSIKYAGYNFTYYS